MAGLLECFKAVRVDPRFTFHVHYLGDLASIGLEQHDKDGLESLGCLQGWRPGNQRPRRGGVFANFRTLYPELDDNYTPDLELHMLHAGSTVADCQQADMSYADLCDFDSCGLLGEGFFDIEYGIGIICRRSPCNMLHHSGVAKVLRNAGIGNATLDPAAVWLLQVEWYDKISFSAVVGCFDGSSGDFIIASIRRPSFEETNDSFPWGYETVGIEELWPVAAVVLRHQSWTHMHTLVEHCWAFAKTHFLDVVGKPLERSLPSFAREQVKVGDTLVPSDLHSDRHHF
jgi:hypothetical protein